MEEQTIYISITSGKLVIGILAFFLGLLAMVWKGKTEIAKAIKEAIGDFKERFISMETKMEVLWKNEVAPAKSPRQLNERGTDILTNSGIKEIVERKKDQLLELIKERNVSNPYDAEISVMEVMNDFMKYCPECIDELKNGAFKAGADISTVLFVGSIYLRNLIFPDLGFSLTDLDAPKK